MSRSGRNIFMCNSNDHSGNCHTRLDCDDEGKWEILGLCKSTARPNLVSEKRKIVSGNFVEVPWKSLFLGYSYTLR